MLDVAAVLDPLPDSCTKNGFCFNGIICKQEDGVLMGSSLGPVHANIIMTELEREREREREKERENH